MADQKNLTNHKSKHAFVRTEDAPLLPPQQLRLG